MSNAERLKELKVFLKKLKKSGLTRSSVRAILRVKALMAYYRTLDIETVANCYDISPKTLKKWIRRFEHFGEEDLLEGDRSGRPPKLSADQQQELKRLIEEQDQRVWVARHIYEVIIRVFGVVYSVAYLPRFLRKLGLSFHKTIHDLVKKDSEKRRRWIQEQLPEIYKQKLKAGWRIFYQDEVGFQTEGTLAYTWGPKGKKIAIKNYGRHGRVNLIGAFELGTGIFHGVLTSFKVNAMRFRRFICHLKRQMRTDKIVLICDNASFHKAKWFTAWANTQHTWLSLEFLPPYSPDFNPIERLWRWLKTEFIHNRCWKSRGDLKQDLVDILKQMPSYASSLKSLMKKENERFAAICEYYAVELMEPFTLAA
jgi:transposase